MREITYAEAIRETLSSEMRRDPHVFMLGEDIGIYGGAFGVSAGMLAEFGAEHVRDTPISEAAITGTAIGAAITGMRPVMEIQFMDFIPLAMEQLTMQAAKMRFMLGGKVNVPLVLRTPAGSGTGAAAQHSESLEAWFVHVPGLKVVMPSTPFDAKGLLLAALRDPNPVVFVEHKLLYRTKGPVPEEDYVIPLGTADVKREGRDLTIVALSIMVPRALAAAAKLAQEGIEAEVVDPRTLKPMGLDTISASVAKTGRLLVVHEACKTGGVGAEISAAIAESDVFFNLKAPIQRLAGLDIPIPYNRTLEQHAVPQEENIVDVARKLMAL